MDEDVIAGPVNGLDAFIHRKASLTAARDDRPDLLSEAAHFDHLSAYLFISLQDCDHNICY